MTKYKTAHWTTQGLVPKPPTRHVRPDGPLGLPYATAGIDSVSYYVMCPVCQHKCRPEARLMADPEDDSTKGAVIAYQFHFLQASREEQKDG